MAILAKIVHSTIIIPKKEKKEIIANDIRCRLYLNYEICARRILPHL